MEDLSNPGIRDEQGKFKKGFSGNPNGRPKDTLKLYAAKKLSEMSDEDKEKFLSQIEKDLIWRMAEGNPSTDSNIAAEIKIIVSEESLQNETDTSTITDNPGQA